MRKARKTAGAIVAAVMVLSAFSLGSGGRNSDLVVIYSNADDEAITAIRETLDENGYQGKYILQTFGTSELGGKLLAEGTNLEADLITMSTFYIESAQDANQMFADLDFDVNTLDEVPSYCAPITAQEGALVYNSRVIEQSGLLIPDSIADLADPVYEDMISVTDVSSSSTAWLLLQALIAEYGEDEAQQILSRIYENAGPHVDKKDGLPVGYVDPLEGNFSLTESAAVVDKGTKRQQIAMDMAECIIREGREKLQKTYPNALYEGETTDGANASAYPKTFPEKLTVELLERHQELLEASK